MLEKSSRFRCGGRWLLIYTFPPYPAHHRGSEVHLLCGCHVSLPVSTSPSPAVRSVVRESPGWARCSSASPFPILTSRKCSVKRIKPSSVLPSETLIAGKGPRDDMYFLDRECRSAQEALCDASISACLCYWGSNSFSPFRAFCNPKSKCIKMQDPDRSTVTSRQPDSDSAC